MSAQRVSLLVGGAGLALEIAYPSYRGLLVGGECAGDAFEIGVGAIQQLRRALALMDFIILRHAAGKLTDGRNRRLGICIFGFCTGLWLVLVVLVSFVGTGAGCGRRRRRHLRQRCGGSRRCRRSCRLWRGAERNGNDWGLAVGRYGIVVLL